jgi:hypothetical protein
MTALWLLVTGAVMFVAGAAGAKMIGDQVETILLRLPYRLLRLARRRAGLAHRDELYAEWVDDLDEATADRTGRPVSQLVFGIWFAVGVIVAAPLVARERAHLSAFARSSLGASSIAELVEMLDLLKQWARTPRSRREFDRIWDEIELRVARGELHSARRPRRWR